MNKMFWIGLSMFLIQVIGGALTYGTYWALNQGLSGVQLITIVCFALFNLTSGMFMILGASTNE